jgi:hypothetical protein
LSSLTGFRTPLLPVHSLVTMEAPIHKRKVRTLLPGVLKLFLFLCVETASGSFQNFYNNPKINVCIMFLFLSRGAAAPLGPSPPHCYGLETTLRHSSHSIELLRTFDRPVAETST